MYAMRSFKAFKTKKNEADANLKYKLIAVIQRVQNGEFAESRLRIYKNIQKILLENCRSNVKAEGLKSIFYARYFTFSQLLENEAFDEYAELRKKIFKHFPNREFKEIVDYEIQQCLRLNQEDVYKRDSYSIIIKQFLRDEVIGNEFLEWEHEATIKLTKEPKGGYLRDHFNTLNRETFPYLERLLSQDIKNLTKSPERCIDFLDRNKGLIGLMVATIGIIVKLSV
jgi:hypothetical protein